MSTNFITQNEFKQQQEKIARRKRMAELIRASAATPIESPGVAGAKTSPWQVLIKALQGGIGGYEENRANKEEAALLARQDAAEQNANEQFAAEQYQFGPQIPLPERPPDYITPTETFAVPDSLTPHQAPEMLPGTDQAEYLASIAPTVTSQIPEQVPGREMPPDMASNAPTDGIPLPVFSSMNPTGANQAPVPEQVPGREMPPLGKRPVPRPFVFPEPAASRAASEMASNAPTVEPQIPEQVPGREMPPPPPPPPTYIQSLVAALGQNKKSNEYVDQRRLALANVLNSKDPNKIKFVLDQMGSREQFEQQRQLASEQAGYGLTAAELKFNRDVKMAKDKGDLDEVARLSDQKAKILAAETQVDAQKEAALRLAEVNRATALELSKVDQRAAAALFETQMKRGETEINAKIAAAKLVADAKSAREKILKNQSSSNSEKLLKAPVAAQTEAINNQLLADLIEEGLVLLQDPEFDDAMSLPSLMTKSFSSRMVPGKAIRLYSVLDYVKSMEVLNMTGKAGSAEETLRFRGFTPNVSGGFFGQTADTKGSAITKLTQYQQGLKQHNDIISRVYGFTVPGGRPPEVPPEKWWNFSQEDKDAYVPAPPGLSAEESKQWATFPNSKRRKIVDAGENDATSK
jgi:hypothetical protein